VIATAAPRRRRGLAAVLRRYGWSYIFVLPTFSLFVVFTLLPVAQGLVLSLQNARVTGGEFIGLANFETLAADPVFIQAVGNTILYATVVVAAQITLASSSLASSSRSARGRTSSTARSSTCRL